MQSLLMVLALPPLLLLATMYNGWKFRSFERGRYDRILPAALREPRD